MGVTDEGTGQWEAENLPKSLHTYKVANKSGRFLAAYPSCRAYPNMSRTLY